MLLSLFEHFFFRPESCPFDLTWVNGNIYDFEFENLFLRTARLRGNRARPSSKFNIPCRRLSPKTVFILFFKTTEMASHCSWILLCLVIFSAGVTTRSLEDYYDYYDYDEALYRRSNQQQDEAKNIELRMPDVHPVKVRMPLCLRIL